MAAHKLPNYLRMYRKRAGFSQREAAFLLGCQRATKMSRYERFSRQPNLETALACEIVFGVPVRELLAGTFQKVEELIHQRAQILAEKLTARKPDRVTRQKLDRLKAMTSALELEPDQYGLHPAQ